MAEVRAAEGPIELNRKQVKGTSRRPGEGGEGGPPPWENSPTLDVVTCERSGQLGQQLPRSD